MGTEYTAVSKICPCSYRIHNPVFSTDLSYVHRIQQRTVSGGFTTFGWDGSLHTLPVDDSQVDGVDFVLEALESPESFSSRF